jgi:crotonobetainyl-CoA:carnitine CoA-transferase CaiB-like acyl-CoA transferase
MGVLDGLKVLDLSWGISGPVAGMLLADHGASVTKIEPPEGGPLPGISGYPVWNRGKRSAVLDLKDEAGRQRLIALASQADVLIESFEPGTADRLGIGYDRLRQVNPGLIYCDITGYGADGPDRDRPGIDALVAARTGQQFEGRGRTGGTIGVLSGTEGMMPGLEAPEGCWVGPDRDGPLFTGVPWVSMATAYIAVIGVNAAIRARGITGQGQRVSPSLLQGVLATTIGGWIQVEHSDAPNFETWVIDPRAPKGFFRGSDGTWMHHWVPLPEFILNASANGMRATPDVASPKDASLRVSPKAEDMVILHAFYDQLTEAVAQHPAGEWVGLAAQVGVPVQPVRSPEEALLDPLLVADGCVVEVSDPQLGPIRQVGRVVELARHPQPVPAGAAPRGAHTAEVTAEADAILAAISRGDDPVLAQGGDPLEPPQCSPGDTPRPPRAPFGAASSLAPLPRPSVAPLSPSATGALLAHPLSGVTVLDLGLAVAGPFGTQVLAQLGARVIKVTMMRDKFWFSNHIAMCCNRDKESITLNLKDPEAMAVLRKLVESADVVQHNMRYDAAERLGIDYETLRQLNPRLIYCHTLGLEQGPRQAHPANDQTGAALAGTTWLDGGLDNGGRPIWSVTSLGDTGNGFLSALGIIQALYDRDRTGEGQFVRTSIIYAQLLNASMAWVSPDGSKAAARPRLDAEGWGWSALYRLYKTSDGYLAIAALTDEHWRALGPAIGRPEMADDARYATSVVRSDNDEALAGELSAAFAGRPAAEWLAILDAAGVPAEVCDPDYVTRLFADPDAERRQLTASFQHRMVGTMKMGGLNFRLSGTPGVIKSGPLWPGQDTKTILADLGYTAEEIGKLIESGAVDDTALTSDTALAGDTALTEA